MEDGTKLRGRVIVGADGGRSRVAADLGLAQPGYAGYSAYRYDAAAAFQRSIAHVAVCLPLFQRQVTTVLACKNCVGGHPWAVGTRMALQKQKSRQLLLWSHQTEATTLFVQPAALHLRLRCLEVPRVRVAEMPAAGQWQWRSLDP